MMEILLLDLDDTILDFKMSEWVALGKTLEQFGVETSGDVRRRYHEINKGHWARLERGEITRDFLRGNRFAQLFRELGREVDGMECAAVYEGFLGQKAIFLPGAREALDELKGKYRLFLASNGNAHVQHGRLKDGGLYDYFEDIFISQEVGHNKPSLKYFEACFARIPGFTGEKAMIVGDSLSSDILGGLGAGINTCWVNPDGKARGEICPHYEIETLADLPALLETL